jgi:threonine 3-dehydrogenase
MAVAIARHVGARYIVVTDLSQERLDLARSRRRGHLASTRRRATCARPMNDLGMREGFDIGLEMSVRPGRGRTDDRHMNHGGRIAMLGLPKEPYPVDWGKVITHMLTIKGIYGREMYDTWYAMSSMLADLARPA